MYGYRPATPELQEWVSRLERVCASVGVTLPAVALHFSLRSPLVDSTVVGISSAQRLAQLDELAATPIPDDVWTELEALGPAPSTIDDSDYA
jgi:D-threo-aldose 1-dehydrogenase